MNLKDSYKKLNEDMIKHAIPSTLKRKFDSKEQKEILTKKEIDLLIMACHKALRKLKKKEERYNKHLDRLESLFTIYDNKIWKNMDIDIDKEIKNLDKKSRNRPTAHRK